MSLATGWASDDLCPACGIALILTDDMGHVGHDCPACGWSATGDDEASG